MCKKLLVATIAILVGVAVVKGTPIGKCARRWAGDAREWVRCKVTPREDAESADSKVKLELEIKRLRSEVERLARDDRIHFDKVVGQRLEVREREAALKANKSELAVLHQRITNLRVAVKAAEGETQQVVYNGASYSKADAEKQIDTDWGRYQPMKASIALEERGLKALRETLAQNEKTLTAFQQRRQEMLVQLQELEKDLVELREAQSVKAAVLDDGKYGRVQRGIQGVQRRLAVEKERMKLHGSSERGPIEQAEAERARKTETEKQMEKEFGPTQGKAPVVRQ